MFDTESFSIDKQKPNMVPSEYYLDTYFTPLKGSTNNNTTIANEEHLVWIEGIKYDFSGCTANPYSPAQHIYYQWVKIQCIMLKK